MKTLLRIWLMMIALSACAGPSYQSYSPRLEGNYENDIYTAPLENFTAKYTVPCPFHGGTCCQAGMSETFDADMHTGGVSFYNEYGGLNGVLYTEIPANKADALSTDDLSGWFRAVPVAMTKDRGLTPIILREEAGEFDGRPAWIAVIGVAGGGVIEQQDLASGQSSRLDSVRGIVVFAKGNFVYGLYSEINVGFEFFRQEYDPENWDDFVTEVEVFYNSMTFSAG